MTVEEALTEAFLKGCPEDHPDPEGHAAKVAKELQKKLDCPCRADKSELETLGNEILQEIQQDTEVMRYLKEDPVNWASLRCFVEGSSHLLYLEEASPEAHRLRQEVKDRLEAEGYPVTVITEW